jgi:hypothetical protein
MQIFVFGVFGSWECTVLRVVDDCKDRASSELRIPIDGTPTMHRGRGRLQKNYIPGGKTLKKP